MILRYLEKKIPNFLFRFLLPIYWSSVIWKKMLEFLFLSAWNRRRKIAALIKRPALFYRRPLIFFLYRIRSNIICTVITHVPVFNTCYSLQRFISLIKLNSNKEYLSRPPPNPFGEIGSRYPLNVYDLKCPTSYSKTTDGAVLCMMFIDLLDGCWYGVMWVEILYLWVMLQKGADDVGEDNDEWEPVEPITSPCDRVWSTEGSAPTNQFK